MTTTAAAQFVGDIPRQYDAHLGPILFAGYADDLARRSAAIGGAEVLEIAAGTGISAVALRAALPAATRLTVTDLNPPMLEVAQRKLTGAPNIVVAQADAMALPFPDAAFDQVVIQFGAMFFPDKPAAFREAARVLRARGTLLFNVWADMNANPFADIVNTAVSSFFPDDPPKFYLTPFGYADIACVRADLAAGGFVDVSAEAVRFEREVRDWGGFARGLLWGNPIGADIDGRGSASVETVRAFVETAMRRRFGREPARMPLEAIVYVARRN